MRWQAPSLSHHRHVTRNHKHCDCRAKRRSLLDQALQQLASWRLGSARLQRTLERARGLVETLRAPPGQGASDKAPERIAGSNALVPPGWAPGLLQRRWAPADVGKQRSNFEKPGPHQQGAACSAQRELRSTVFNRRGRAGQNTAQPATAEALATFLQSGRRAFISVIYLFRCMGLSGSLCTNSPRKQPSTLRARTQCHQAANSAIARAQTSAQTVPTAAAHTARLWAPAPGEHVTQKGATN